MQLAKEDEIDLKQLALVVWRRRYLIAFIVSCSTALAALYVATLPFKYSANVSVQIGLDQTNVLTIEDPYVFEARTQEHYKTQIELIKSRKMLSQVVDKLDLEALYLPREPKFKNELAAVFGLNLASKKVNLSKFERLALLQSSLKVTHTSGSQFITISIDAFSPGAAADIVNLIADQYIDYHSRKRTQVNESTTEWLLNELDELKSKLANAEAELQSFSEEQDLVNIQGVLGLKSEELKALTQQQLEFQRKVDELQIQYTSMENVTDPVVLLNSSVVKSNPIIEAAQQNLTAMQRNWSEIKLRYGPKHPKYLEAQQNVWDAKKSLSKHISALVNGVKREFAAAAEKLAKLKTTIDKTKTEFQGLSRIQGEFRQKQREVKTRQELYDTLLKRLQETKATSGLDKEFATVLDYALPNPIPTSPKKALIVVLGGVLGGVLSLVLSFLLEFRRSGVLDEQELSALTGMPVIAELPKVKRRRKGSEPMLHHELSRNMSYLEAMRTLRTRILVGDSDAKVMAVTSAMPGEGKSSIALHLAHAFAEVEKVLVIDADLRRPSMAAKLGQLQNRPGLVELMSGKYKLSSCLFRNRAHGYDVLCAGNLTDNPSKLLLSPIFPKLVRGLTKYYDRIIIETAPVQLVADAEAVAKAVDGFLFIVKAEDTPKPLVAGGIDKLNQIGANILGIVLNQSDYKLARYQYRQYISDAPPVASNIVNLSHQAKSSSAVTRKSSA